MKLNFRQKGLGLCYRCGKDSRLPIHGACGAASDAEKQAKTGYHGLTPAQQARGRDNANRGDYKAGKVPPWAKG